jgi:hypothetical protein
MENKISFTSFYNWLKSTEMFARPSKQLPGKWQLVEYYTETGNELLNIKEVELGVKKEFWTIEFTAGNKFYHQQNLPVSLIPNVKNGEWLILKNYIVFTFSDNKTDNLRFQFSVENKRLKLLKKDTLGRIEFFGFFNKIN